MDFSLVLSTQRLFCLLSHLSEMTREGEHDSNHVCCVQIYMHYQHYNPKVFTYNKKCDACTLESARNKQFKFKQKKVFVVNVLSDHHIEWNFSLCWWHCKKKNNNKQTKWLNMGRVKKKRTHEFDQALYVEFAQIRYSHFLYMVQPWYTHYTFCAFRNPKL